MSAKLFVPFLNSNGLLSEVGFSVFGVKLLLGVFNLYFDKSLAPAGLHFRLSSWVGRAWEWVAFAKIDHVWYLHRPWPGRGTG
jgi:hypothetical protein